MKLTRENIYINLQGKSKEELIGIQNILIIFNEPTFRKKLTTYYYENKNDYNYFHFNDLWLADSEFDFVKNKQEVTIQQLKEILKPMENTKFKKDDVIIITDFGRVTSNASYNFTLNKPYILEEDFNKENGLRVKIDDNNNKGNGWTNAFDLGIKIELYKEPTLTEQLEKAEAEVKRLKEAIEKESTPKNGDWVVNKYGVLWRCSEVDSKHLLTKITDQELINKLNELIK